MVLGRSAMEILLSAGCAKFSLKPSAPLLRDHSCKSHLPSSQKRRVPSDGYSPLDHWAPPPHRPAYLLPAFRSCRLSPANSHPPKSPPSTHRSASFPSPPSGETLPCCVHVHRHLRPFRGRSSRPSQALSETFDDPPQSRPSLSPESAPECRFPCRSVPVCPVAPSVLAQGTYRAASSCPGPRRRETFRVRSSRCLRGWRVLRLPHHARARRSCGAVRGLHPQWRSILLVSVAGCRRRQ